MRDGLDGIAVNGLQSRAAGLAVARAIEAQAVHAASAAAVLVRQALDAGEASWRYFAAERALVARCGAWLMTGQLRAARIGRRWIAHAALGTRKAPGIAATQRHAFSARAAARALPASQAARLVAWQRCAGCSVASKASLARCASAAAGRCAADDIASRLAWSANIGFTASRPPWLATS
ncbi:MAG: hypothetical protein RL701_4429, partial [Pseudomonadota bacterium]